MTILADLGQTDMLAEIAKLRAENDRLKATPQRGLSLKVSDKGALYRGQWERLAKAWPEIEAFIVANSARLAVKS